MIRGHSQIRYKRWGVGGKKRLIVNFYTIEIRKCKRRGVGGQKKPNLVDVGCERPLVGSQTS